MSEKEIAAGCKPAAADESAGAFSSVHSITRNAPVCQGLQNLARQFTTPEPGETRPDPGSLGDPQSWPDGWRLCVALLQRGVTPATVAGYLTPEQISELSGAGLSNTPDLLVTARLANRWRVLGIGDLLVPAIPPIYLLQGMIRMPSHTCVYGAPGGFKSMLIADLAVCVAAGIPWLPPLPDVGKGGAYAVRQCPVLIVDQDNGHNRMQERIGALCRARGVTDAPIHVITMPRPLIDLGNDADTDLLCLQAKRLDVGMIVLDNLGTFSGGRDENSSQMVSVMANARWLTEDTGAGVFTIHHSRKGARESGGRAGDNLRGHSSIEASLDLALYVERAEDEFTVKSTKTRDDPVRPFVGQWTYEKNEHGALDTGRMWHMASVETDRPEYMALAEELPDMIAEMDGTPNQSEVVRAAEKHLKTTRNTVLQAIRYAIGKGWIAEESTSDRKNAPKRYRTL